MKEPEALDLGVLGEALPQQPGKEARPCRTPESFLGPSASSLVNLDSLVKAPLAARTRNPFLTGRAFWPGVWDPTGPPLSSHCQVPIFCPFVRRSGCSVPNQPVWRGRSGQADPKPDAYRLPCSGPAAGGTRRGARGLYDLQRLSAPSAQQRAGRRDPPRLGQRLPASGSLRPAAGELASATAAHVRPKGAAAPAGWH